MHLNGHACMHAWAFHHMSCKSPTPNSKSGMNLCPVLTHNARAAIEHDSKHLLKAEHTTNIGVVFGVVTLPISPQRKERLSTCMYITSMTVIMYPVRYPTHPCIYICTCTARYTAISHYIHALCTCIYSVHVHAVEPCVLMYTCVVKGIVSW